MAQTPMPWVLALTNGHCRGNGQHHNWPLRPFRRGSVHVSAFVAVEACMSSVPGALNSTPFMGPPRGMAHQDHTMLCSHSGAILVRTPGPSGPFRRGSGHASGMHHHTMGPPRGMAQRELHLSKDVHVQTCRANAVTLVHPPPHTTSCACQLMRYTGTLWESIRCQELHGLATMILVIQGERPTPTTISKDVCM